MESLPLPKNLKFIKEEGNQSVFVLEPCYPGYGDTIGNALRRVMLSSLPGGAVTAVKIIGVDHEFSSVPGVKEDMIDIILNLKKLYIKSHSTEPIRLHLKVKGAKEITAAMIDKNDQVEIGNPDLKIATLDGKNSEIEMELVVEQGRGYSTVEMREGEKLEIGMIAIDAFFTPVRNAHFLVENMRVGKMTNYHRLTFTILTNGTISGKDALEQSAELLVDHFKLLEKDGLEQAEKEAKKEIESEKLEEVQKSTEEPASAKVSLSPVTDDLLSLGLSRRSYNALLKNGVKTLKDLKELNEEKLESFSGLGDKSIKEILEVILTL
ncbi:MAG: DNA-directed RNA polymerase subunit alpha [Candidatus Doudnabacteria bacterium CG10_big_fil_rev_8_21_14_0_10_41_10]|uniref:DNA-directed RNA polymerase subunit alpha n=1 Tax=Candidatus Doudnabacteria bacterium CG10_big_fil_rev_8_21_14_0_10_41_10 TaxID=1974551 RepID=A0A2H0VFE7_9BACT|nr:MAG: DNA-directed RNA polymerase subunit alpha [Candidatus Doudnabacteria bacterium CG10_big_fil_rev_8_21_14_0_10_41_10]